MGFPGVKEQLLAQAGERRKLRATGEFVAKEEQLLSELHPKQLNFVLDESRNIAAVVARGGGKTWAGTARFVRRMMRTAKAKCVYIATARTAAEELIWAPLKETAERLELDCHFNETKLKMTIKKNGSWVQLCGADDKKEIEKLRGRPFHEVGIDEAASHDRKLLKHLMQRIVGPRLGDYHGTMWLIGTPGHILSGEFYDITRPSSPISRLYEDRFKPEYQNWIRWSRHWWSLQDNTKMPHLWAEALRQKEVNGWSDDNPIWRREYMGLWAADDTGYVYRFRKHTDDGLEWNLWVPGKRTPNNPFGLPEGHEWFYIIGMDMGWQDPFALVVLAYSPTSKNLYHVYEFSRQKMLVHEIASLLNNLFGKIGGYPMGLVADTTKMGGHILAELAAVHGISVEAAEQKNKNDSIELMNSDLVEGRFKTWEGSALSEEMIGLQWDETGLKESKSLPNHLCDASIYARRKALHHFAVEPSGFKPPEPGSVAWWEAKEREAEERAAMVSVQGDDGPVGPDNFDSFFGD